MKKVLIVTYYWPPAGGIGVLRCLKIAKYLRSFGWEPIIYTVDNPNYPFEDESNFKDIPKDIEVLKHAALQFENVFKKAVKKEKQSINNVVFSAGKKSSFMKFGIWVRANFFIPDAKALWIKPSVKYLSKYLKENKVDAVFSDGPPHTNTVIALKIAKKFNIPWLSDYQDPWTQVDYYNKFPLSKWADARHKALEFECLTNADKIISASPSFSEGLSELGAKNPGVVYYGYDEDDFKNIKSTLDQKFSIIHAGILASDRLPYEFLKALASIIKEDEQFKKDLVLKLIGSIDDETLEIIKTIIPKGNLELTGLISRNEVLQQISNVQVLLNLVNKINSKGRIPGKIYEYFRAKRPIVSIGDTKGDVAKLIEETQSGACFEYEDFQNTKDHLLKLYAKFKTEDLKETKGKIEHLSNYNQTQIVANYLDEISNG